MRVRIIGGGLSGILAALQAHRLGISEIELHERFDQLGGIALPDRHGDREFREGCIYFGPEGDPIRSLLEKHCVEFVEFENRFGSVAPGDDGPLFVENFGGPACEASNIALSPRSGQTLANRLACYDIKIAAPLARYVAWHTGIDPSDLHESASIPLAINRIYPAMARTEALAAAKRSDPLADELFGIPRALWGYATNAKASVPKGGFAQLFRQCRIALEAIGVRVHECDFVRPDDAISETPSDQLLVWAASPMPLFKAVGMKPPRAPAKRFATYTFAVDWTGPVPFYVQNFAPDGVCWRAYFYESGGGILLTAECVAEGTCDTLANEISAMIEGFEGDLKIGDLLHSSLKPRWLFHSVETINALSELRTTLDTRMGGRFVSGAWEAYAKGDKFREIENEICSALSTGLVDRDS